ncbi:MAG: IseA DL-endopeptidase inhibitor family protein [Defluviitaleaceae bacterium]|nr:IseA DL-endopeptidase inhibitor family protein [Defluviitaleaceae bacterium]
MKKLFYSFMAAIFLLFALTACNGNGEEYVPPPHTIEELGNTIVTVGNLWEDWWSLSGHFDNPPWQSLADVRNYLLQYYTENFVDTYLLGENSIFAEYNSELLINADRWGAGRLNWENATHMLIEQDGGHAIVETIFKHGFWHRDDVAWTPSELRFHFHFVDGRIDVGLSPMGQHPDIIWQDTRTGGDQLTLEEMGEIIVAMGHFWEDWWFMQGDFANPPWQALEDVRKYLAQYYTDAYLYAHLLSVFDEENGQLTINDIRIGTLRPMWENATHRLISRSYDTAIVETTFRMGYPRGYDWWDNISEVRFYFTFVGGRIHIGTSPWTWDDSIVWLDRIWTFEELSWVIQRTWHFWNSWWNFQNIFGMQHVSFDNVPPRLEALGYAHLLPSSGFYDADTVRWHLGRDFTESWIEQLLGEEYPIFLEYNGQLFIQMARGIFSYPADWENVNLVLVEQEGDTFVIDFTMSGHQKRITLVDGKIDSGFDPWFGFDITRYF